MGIGLRSAAAAVALLALAGAAAAGDDEVQQELKKTKEQVEKLQKRMDELEGRVSKPAPSGAPAGNSNVSAPGCRSLKFSGQVLVWGERWDGTYRPTDPAGTDVQDVGWLRVALQADADIEEGLRARVEIRDARAFGQEPSTTTQAQAPGTGLDLKQGWCEVDDVLGGGAKVRAGRMVLSYGEQRLVGDLDWATYGRSFDGVLATRVFEATKTKADLFATRVTERGLGTVTPGVDNDDRDFFGVYTTTPKALHHSDLDLYALYLRDLVAAPGEAPGSAGNTGFWTGGARISGVKGALDWGAEGAVQDGRLNGDRLRAWAAHAEAGWNLLDSKGAPRFSLEVDRATGDGNPGNGSVGSFQTLFPTNHNHYGILDLMAWQNMQAVGAALRLKPAPQWTAEFGAWKLWLDGSSDAWYASNGTVIRPAAPGASRSLGTELDAVLTWKHSDHLKVSLGGSQFFDGAFVRQTGGGGDTFWCYIRVQVDF